MRFETEYVQASTENATENSFEITAKGVRELPVLHKRATLKAVCCARFVQAVEADIVTLDTAAGRVTISSCPWDDCDSTKAAIDYCPFCGGQIVVDLPTD